jgi:hypothetical protein
LFTSISSIPDEGGEEERLVLVKLLSRLVAVSHWRKKCQVFVSNSAMTVPLKDYQNLPRGYRRMRAYKAWEASVAFSRKAEWYEDEKSST